VRSTPGAVRSDSVPNTPREPHEDTPRGPHTRVKLSSSGSTNKKVSSLPHLPPLQENHSLRAAENVRQMCNAYVCYKGGCFKGMTEKQQRFRNTRCWGVAGLGGIFCLCGKGTANLSLERYTNHSQTVNSNEVLPQKNYSERCTGSRGS